MTTRFLFVLCCALITSAAFAEPVMLYDFTQGIHGWTGNPRVKDMTITDEGLAFSCTGLDPWIESPVVENMPMNDRVRITVRMKSTADRSGEFFFGPRFAPEDSARFLPNPDGEWHEYSVLLPAQPEGTRLRLDPSLNDGAITVAWIEAEALHPLSTTEFEAPSPVAFEKTLEVVSENITLRHNGADWDGYALYVDDALMAMGHSDSALGFLVDGKPVMFPLRDAKVTAATDAGVLTVEAAFTDSDGTTWKLTRTIRSHSQPGTLEVQTSITVNADKELYHLPWLTLFPGLGSFGEEKNQALLPGVEYLENEPSSSEADFNAAQADRRIVDDYKLTLPLMALQQEGRYIGVLWNRADHPAAVFDSPDRVFNSGAHLMGLWHPGVGEDRLENEFSVFGTFTLKKDTPLQMTFSFLGGKGDSLAAVSQHYIAMRGLPEVQGLSPSGLSQDDFNHARRLLAAGWLDSDLHEDGLWRHALWGDNFKPQSAADAPAFMLWLARHTDDTTLATRLREAAKHGLSRLNPPDHYEASVSHVKRPAPILLFGSIENNVARMVDAARHALGQFDEQGLRRYHQPDPERPDYSRTHFADHANGYNAQVLEPILAAAVFSGDQALAEAGLRLLDKQTAHYANTVPRGAQTWEMPLHTPDILGSANLIRTYVLGYLLSGHEDYIEQARYWAWTGIPLIYLDPPVEAPVGIYATIAVVGATSWIAPNWVGQPVQWCGLVYRSALHDLARLDTEQGTFWEKAANGITLSGLQQTFPLDDEKRQGLLPDFFHLREQVSDGPAISPGTVQAGLAEAYGKTPYYTTARLNAKNVLLHVPGDVADVKSSGNTLTATITGWASEPYWIRITNVTPNTTATWNNTAPIESVYDEKYGALNLRIEGSGTLLLGNL